MLKSMTGFGRFESETPERKISVEMKAVNHRYCEISLKMPKKLNFFESAIRNLLKNYISRGKVDIFIIYEDFTEGLVIVDAGHGGYDGGAEGNGVLEKDVNLEISYKLKDELILRGYNVKMTRSDDSFVGLTQRASIANAQDEPVCLISIHQNSLEASEGLYMW